MLLEFKLTHYNVTVVHFNHYATETSSPTSYYLSLLLWKGPSYIPIVPSDKLFPFDLQRRQFLVSVYFGMPANKTWKETVYLASENWLLT